MLTLKKGYIHFTTAICLFTPSGNPMHKNWLTVTVGAGTPIDPFEFPIGPSQQY
jgi:hypothetical protein